MTKNGVINSLTLKWNASTINIVKLIINNTGCYILLPQLYIGSFKIRAINEIELD